MVAYYHDNTLLHESEILQIMENQLLHTPDGVRDIYNGECKKKLYLQDKLHRTLLKYGYHDIMTPTFEFFNIFGSDVGTTPSKDLYKFFDKEGNTLVLRPDFTPSIARSAAKYYIEDDMPVKLCYLGNTFINSSDYQDEGPAYCPPCQAVLSWQYFYQFIGLSGQAQGKHTVRCRADR